MEIRILGLAAVTLLVPSASVFAEQQIDSFDDISGYSIYAPSGGSVHQGVSPDPIDEGTSSLVVEYAPLGTADAVYINQYITPIDLSAEATAGGVMSIRMWVAAETVTARLISMAFETAYLSEFSYSWPLNRTWDLGWNTVVVPLADFTIVDTEGTPSWSNIGQLKMQTGMYPTPPAEAVGDLVLDDWRVLGAPPFDPADLNTDGVVDSFDLGILLGNFGTTTTPDMGELSGAPPVDSFDLGVLLGAFGFGSSSALSAVPEPGGIVLLGLGTMLVSLRRVGVGVRSNMK